MTRTSAAPGVSINGSNGSNCCNSPGEMGSSYRRASAAKASGYAVAHYSKFVRPGYLRYNSTYNPSPSVYVTAYGGSTHHVIVALNLGSTAVNQPFTIQGATVTSLTAYQTSASGNMVQLGAVGVSNGNFTNS